MVTQEYLENKINDFELHHQYRGYLTNNYDKEISRRWKDEQSRRNQKWQDVRNNADVYDLINRYDNIVTYYEDAEYSFYEDSFDMALSLYDAIQGLRKLAKFVEVKPWITTQFSPISVEEADDIFLRLDSIVLRMDDVNLRRAMSD